jgi:hypothetical protein
MLMAWSLAILSEEAILSRWELRSPFIFDSPSVVVGSTGFDGGWSSGSGGAGGADAWGGSAGISSGGLALGFRAVLGIKKYGRLWLEFCSLTKRGSPALDGPRLEKFKMDCQPSVSRIDCSSNTTGEFCSQLTPTLPVWFLMSNGFENGPVGVLK